MDRNDPAQTDTDAPELLTLKEWAQRCGYSYGHASALSRQEGFPQPVPDRYREEPKRRARTFLPPEADLERAVTLDEFADLIDASAKHVRRVATTHPEPLPSLADPAERTAWPTQGHRRVRELLTWWNARPATTTRVNLYRAKELKPFEPLRPPPPPSAQELGVGPQEEMTLNRFASLIGVDGGTVGQYRRLSPERMPRTADGRRVQDLAHGEQATFRFQDLHRWWTDRPGSRAGYRAEQDRGGRGRRSPHTAPEGVTLSGFAKRIGVDPAKMHRRRQKHAASMPDTVDGRRPETLAKGERARFSFEELRTWWETLPAETKPDGQYTTDADPHNDAGRSQTHQGRLSGR